MRIAVGVSGGIAAYKACEIVRQLTDSGATVQVLMTRNAERFINSSLCFTGGSSDTSNSSF